VNGQLEAITNVSFSQDYGSFPLFLGSSGQPGFDRKLSGALDEVCLFSRVVNASEISADYFAGLAGKCKMPKIVTQPQNGVAYWGSSIAFTSAAAGALPLKYQWRKDGAEKPAATNATLTLSNVTRADAGTYLVVVTNDSASLQSSNAVVRVLVAERLSPPTLIAGDRLQLLFTDADGGSLLTTNDLATFDVMASTNLVDWTVITNALSLTNGSILFEDSTTNYPARYYRVLER